MLGLFSHVRLFAALQTVAHQAPLSIGFSSQGYQSGLPCLPPGDLPNPGIEPTSLKSPALVRQVLHHMIMLQLRQVKVNIVHDFDILLS